MRVIKLIQKYSFLALGISLSLPIALQSKIVFLFVLIQVSFAFIFRYHITIKNKLLPILFISLYLIGVLSLVYSSDLAFGMNKVVTQLSLALIAFVLIIYSKERIRNLSASFYIGLILGNLFVLLFLVIGFLYTTLFKHMDVSSATSMKIFESLLDGYNHRTYLGIALIAGYLVFNSILIPPNQRQYNLLRILFAVLIWIIIFLSGARSITIVFSMILILQIWISLSLKRSIVISLVVIISFALLYSIHPRMSKYISWQSAPIGEVLRSNIRYDLWSASWDLIEKKPMLGYGIGGGQSKLAESTSHLEELSFTQLSPNSHNQFVQSWLDSGVFGSLMVVVIMIVFIITNKGMNKLMRFGLPLLFFSTMLFEVILYRLSGVLIFSTLLLIPPSKSNLTEKSSRRLISLLLGILALLIMAGILSNKLIKFDPTAPSTYMSLNHSEIEYQVLPSPLPNNFPVDTKGCLLDKDSFQKTMKGNLYAQSILDEANVKHGDSIALAIYCFISQDFNGDEVRISGREQIQEPNDQYANLQSKEKWQLLTINTTAIKGRALFVLTIGKHNVSEIDSIRGEVIVAYPQMIIKKVH